MLGAGLLKGLRVTARNFFQSYYVRDRLVTIQYPEQRTRLTENARSFPFLVYDETPENPRCVACKICEQECPPQCIYIEVDRDPQTGKPVRRPKVFEIDCSVCMQCQICVEVCPFDAIKMDQQYELSRFNRFHDLLFDKNALLNTNAYYHSIHPHEADEVDEHLSKARKKPTAASPSAPPAPSPPN